MATTAQELITKAFRWLGVLSEGETMSAQMLDDGLSSLNDMMHGFGPMGVEYAHVTLAAADTVNVPDEQVRNVRLMLAAELASEYEVTLSELRAVQILEAKNALQAAYANQPPGLIDRALLPHHYGRFNMARGE